LKQILANIKYYTGFEVNNISINPEEPKDLTGISYFITIAKENNQELLKIRKQIEEKEISLKLAKLDYKPDFNFFALYSYRQEFRDYVSFGVSFNLPVWKKYRQDRKVLEVGLLKAKEEKIYDDTFNKIKSRIEDSFYKAKSAYESYQIFKDYLTPQTKKVYESILSEYEVGTKNIFDVLKALNQILSVKLKTIEKISEFNIAYKDIQRLTGEMK